MLSAIEMKINWDRSVSITSGCEVDFDFSLWQEQEIFATNLRLALVLTQPHMGKRAFFPRIQLLECEAEQSSPSSAEVDSALSFTSTYPYFFMV
jgi:hypothetical protein